MQLGKIIKINKKYKLKNFNNVQFHSKLCQKNDLFIAIKGEKQNGNYYIKDAIKNNAKTIVSSNKFEGFKNGVLYIYNKNPRKFLAEITSKIYKSKPDNLFAVTGTNGKSSIANFYHQILTLNKKKVASFGTLGVKVENKTYNSNNTTLDSLQINKYLEKIKKKNINNVILEASSHGLKQNRLDFLEFNLGIFTNLSRDHLDYHKTYKEYLNSKLILFKSLMKKNSKIIFRDDIIQKNILFKICKKNNLTPITIGGKNSTINILEHYYNENKQYVSFKFKKEVYNFETKLIGKFQIINLLMAIIAAVETNIPLKNVLKIIKKIKPVNGRMEEVGKLKNLSKIILDYAHTPDALEASLKSIKNQFKKHKINIVFGCGGERDKPKRKIMGKIANKYCDQIFLTDDNPRNENPKIIRNQIKKYIKKKKLNEIPSRKKAISSSIKKIKSNEILLVAGKGHENYQEYKKKNLFSDKKCIKENIKIKNKQLSTNWKLNVINEHLDKNKKINNKTTIKNASINSKKILKNDIFIGLKGRKHNGDKFANMAIKNGASIAIVENNYGVRNKKKIKLKDSYEFFRKSSQRIRQISNIKSIAVTGSSGKTSVKELLGNTLKKFTSVTYSKKSYNNKYGVPLSLYSINKNHKFGVFEVGMDRKGEINNLTELIQPDFGIITNVSYAHIKNFKNLKQIALAKSEIMDHMEPRSTIILNKDDKFYPFFKKKAIKKKIKVLSFSMKKKADSYLKKIVKKKNFSQVKVIINNKPEIFKVKNNMISYIPNILIVALLISILFKNKKINKNIFYNFKTPSGRGDSFKLRTKNKLINFIDESYNSNPLSLKFAINNFNNLDTDISKKKILLGDMLELGKHSQYLHDKSMEFINRSNTNKVFVFGKFIAKSFNKIKTQKKGKILHSKIDILNFIKKDLKNKDYLMVKASNGTGIFKIMSKIKSKGLNAL